MRFAKDRSNINAFAYFVGAKIVDYAKSGENAVQLANGNTFIHAGDYAIVDGNNVKKWYSGEIEDLFETSDEWERLPEGWKAYPEGFDFSVFGTLTTQISYEDSKRLSDLLYEAKYATFLTRKSKVQALKANPHFASLSHAVNGVNGEPLSVDEAFTLFYGENPLECQHGGMAGRFYTGSENTSVMVTGFTATPLEVQKSINRSVLTEF